MEYQRPTVKAAVLLFIYFAAMAAGLVEFSLAAGYLTGQSAPTPGLVVACAATLLAGLCFLMWALWGLHRNALVLTRYAAPALTLAAVGHVAAIATGLGSVPKFMSVSDLAAFGLVLMALAGTGWLRRQHKTNDGGAGAPPRSGRLLAAAFGAAVVVSSVATPGLAASLAGQHAVPHGEHGQAPAPAQNTNLTLNQGHHH
ncbi:hypothetical protein SB659_16590 [Arthrobacter sp. SIMBA_036]|uniref:hypothetical protein n=1 Tax=Arthrobacter sp. SIMBA_036 TaxID=3085778 RepID=UPI00397CD086